MKLSLPLQSAIADTGARIRVGYPWWLRPLLSRDVIAITLGRYVFVRPDIVARSADELERLLRHELVHVRQVTELGLAPFLWRYSAEFIRHYRVHRSVEKAYRDISFEQEAWAAEEEIEQSGL
jgi:hypothetical protein